MDKLMSKPFWSNERKNEIAARVAVRRSFKFGKIFCLQFLNFRLTLPNLTFHTVDECAKYRVNDCAAKNWNGSAGGRKFSTLNFQNLSLFQGLLNVAYRLEEGKVLERVIYQDKEARVYRALTDVHLRTHFFNKPIINVGCFVI
jgi:hypothetical protein